MVCEWLDRVWEFILSVGEFFGNIGTWAVPLYNFVSFFNTNPKTM